MRLKLSLLLTLGALCFINAPMSMADDNNCIFQGSIVSPNQIEKNVQDLGYSIDKEYFEKIDDGCVYKVKAKDKAGQKWKLYFDPINGKLIAKKAED